MTTMGGTSHSEHVRWTRTAPALRGPTLITAFEGWNDAGDAATIAAGDLASRWGCERLADIDPEPFYDFASTRPTISLDENKFRSVGWPSNELHAAEMPGIDTDVVMLIGIEPQLRWRTFCQQVVGAAHALGVERVITLGALLAEVPHSRTVEVYGTTEDEHSREELDLRPSTYEGPTGIVGVLSSACRDAGFRTASFWAAVPSYLPGARSPKAALALVRRVCTTVGMPVRTSELERAAQAYEAEVGKIVSDDAETADYVARLEQAWDRSQAQEARRALRHHPDRDDPDKLVAEVEKYLRDSS